MCVILDAGLLSDSAMRNAAAAVIRGGADSIQLRCKGISSRRVIDIAEKIAPVCKRHGVPLIINDRVEAALAVKASGVHLGQGDIGAGFARKLLGRRGLIGVSVSDLAQARIAILEGASYLGAGPVFETPIKSLSNVLSPDSLRRIAGMGLPVIAIGGIEAGNVKILKDRGIRSVAVIRAVCSARNKRAAARHIKKALTDNHDAARGGQGQ